jgi:hypothetical protein
MDSFRLKRRLSAKQRYPAVCKSQKHAAKFCGPNSASLRVNQVSNVQVKRHFLVKVRRYRATLLSATCLSGPTFNSARPLQFGTIDLSVPARFFDQPPV